MRSNRWLVWVYAGIACVFISSCARPKQAGEDFSPVVDSVGKVVTGLLVQQDFARAKEVIDSADAAGWLTPYNAEMMRLRVLEREDANMPEVQQRYEKLLEQDLTPGQQAEMGSVMVRLGRTEEGLAMIDEALQALDGVKQFAYMDACILAMKSYIRTLNDLNRYEEVIPVGERIVAKLQDFAAHPEVYDDGSVRMPNDARRLFFVKSKYAISRKNTEKYNFLFVYLHICKKSCTFAADFSIKTPIRYKNQMRKCVNE